MDKLSSHRRQTVEKLGSHRRQTVDALVNVFHRLAAVATTTAWQASSHRRQTVDKLGSHLRQTVDKLGSHRRQTVDALVDVFHRLAAGGYSYFTSFV